MRRQRVRQWSTANWFVLVLPILVVAALLISRPIAWGADGAGLEAALIFDVCVSVPLLFALCYHRSLPRRQLALRMVALACLGIFLLGYLIPADGQRLLPSFTVARWAGLAILMAFELWLVVKGVTLVFGAGVTAEELQAKTGAPPFIARLMVLEARFWKWVWRLIRRR